MCHMTGINYDVSLLNSQDSSILFVYDNIMTQVKDNISRKYIKYFKYITIYFNNNFDIIHLPLPNVCKVISLFIK